MSGLQPFITINLPGGQRSVSCVAVHGAWAVHKETAGNTWAITYVPTGRRIPRSQTVDLTKAQAIAAARRLDDEIGRRRMTRAVGEHVVAIIHGVMTEAAS